MKNVGFTRQSMAFILQQIQRKYTTEFRGQVILGSRINYEDDTKDTPQKY